MYAFWLSGSDGRSRGHHASGGPRVDEDGERSARGGEAARAALRYPRFASHKLDRNFVQIFGTSRNASSELRQEGRLLWPPDVPPQPAFAAHAGHGAWMSHGRDNRFTK